MRTTVKIWDGSFEVVVDRVLPLAQAQDAHEATAANENNAKIVCETGGFEKRRVLVQPMALSDNCAR